MKKILVVDDEAPIRARLKSLFEESGYRAEEASDGIEALAKIVQDDFDLVTTDLKMPKMYGMEVIEQMNSIKPTLPIFVISGHLSPELAEEAFRKGATRAYLKPVDLIELRNSVQETLG